MTEKLEPVAWMYEKYDGDIFIDTDRAHMNPEFWHETPLYTRPTPAAPVANCEITTSTVDDREPAVRDTQTDAPDDVIEAMALAYAKAFFGPRFNPFTYPEAYDEAEKATRAAYAAAREAVTGQVVEWLQSQYDARLASRSEVSAGGPDYDLGRATAYGHAADALERGEHLR